MNETLSFFDGSLEPTKPDRASRFHTSMQMIGGKKRPISKPNRPMRVVHEIFVRYLHGQLGVRGSKQPVSNILSTWDYAFFLRGQRYHLDTDLRSAYRNVDVNILAEVLTHYDDSIDTQKRLDIVKKYLTRYHFVNGELTQGGLASPDLFNMYCDARIDYFMRSKCTEMNLQYARYVDNITISGAEEFYRERQEFYQIIRRADFGLNHRMTHFTDARRKRFIILGFALGRDEHEMHLTSAYLDKLEHAVHAMACKLSQDLPLAEHDYHRLCGLVSGLKKLSSFCMLRSREHQLQWRARTALLRYVRMYGKPSTKGIHMTPF